MHLPTLRITELGDAQFVGFVGPDVCLRTSDDGQLELVDPAGGRPTPVRQCPQPDPTALRGGEWANASLEVLTRERVLLRSWRFAVRDRATGDDVLQLDAIRAVLIGESELLVAAPWTGESTNIFVVDIDSRKATFVATARLEGRHPVLGLAGNDQLLLWTDNLGGGPEGIEERTNMYERSSGLVTTIDKGLFGRFTPDGLIAEPATRTGPSALIAPTSLEYQVVIPAFGVSWSPDYRYASSGDQILGFDGACFEVFPGRCCPLTLIPPRGMLLPS